jgi:diaminohydroxyphosphoribosylaminopyrimidine deaminase/5-amino-6-(5-phosphoribosylamino)uracil reductase
LRIPLESKVVTDKLAETWIFTSENYDKEKRQILEEKGISVFVTSGPSRVDAADVMSILGEKLVSSVLIEGGGTVNASLLEKGLIDKVVIYIAPKLVGGAQAPSFLEGTGIEKMSDAVVLTNVEVTKIGKDFKFTGYVTC